MKRILLVEDQEDVISALQSVLPQDRIELTVAMTMHEAIKALETRSYDLVLTDFSFPGGNGNDVANLARQKGISTIWLHTGDPEKSDISVSLFAEVFQKFDKGMIQRLKTGVNQ